MTGRCAARFHSYQPLLVLWVDIVQHSTLHRAVPLPCLLLLLCCHVCVCVCPLPLNPSGADSVGAQYSYAMVAPNEFNMYPASKIEAIPAGSEKGAFKAAPHEFDHSMQHTNVQQDSQAATKQQSKAANTQSSKESNTKESKAAGSAVAAPHGAEHIPLR